MFNGTRTRAPGEFDRLMEGNGGRNNAYTSSDVTVYQDWFPRTALDLVFDLEADRMRNLDFDPKAVESERGVVYSERRSSVDNDNFGVLAEQIQATAYVAHPYQFPTIGWPSDIEGWTIEDLKTYYQRYYAPNNAVVFVVGDVTAAEVFALAEKHLAPIKAQPAPEAVTTREPPQLGERRLKIVRDAQTPLIAMAWHAGSAPERQSRIMEVLLAVLGGGDSSRLHQKLVEQEQAALEIGVQLDQGFDPGLAWLFAVVPPGGDVARIEKLIDEELVRIGRDGPTPAELAKARNQALASFWRGLETINGRRRPSGHMRCSTATSASCSTHPANTRALPPTKCARPQRRFSAATTEPLASWSRYRQRSPLPRRPRRRSREARRPPGGPGPRSRALRPGACATVDGQRREARPFRAAHARERRGARADGEARHAARLDARLAAGGSLGDPAGKEGSAALLAELLEKGAGKRDALAFAEAIESVGGELAASAETESLAIEASFLARDVDLMVELVADALLRPRLDPQEFSKARTLAVQSIAAAKDADPRQLIGIYGDAWLFAEPVRPPHRGQREVARVHLARRSEKLLRCAVRGRPPHRHRGRGYPSGGDEAAAGSGLRRLVKVDRCSTCPDCDGASAGSSPAARRQAGRDPNLFLAWQRRCGPHGSSPRGAVRGQHDIRRPV